MVEILKCKIWEILEKKQVSLAMLYDKAGDILWTRGREISSKNISEGGEFSSSLISKSLKMGRCINSSDILVTLPGASLPESARRLYIKSILIQPLDNDIFLYIDSGSKDSFSDTEIAEVKIIGNLLAEAIRYIKKREADSNGISGESEAMKKIKELVLKYSLEEEPLLLLGETGVGKTHIAELIHNYSGRKGKFVVADTTIINEHLFESEIFGHKRGAFTGAVANKRGLIEEAGGGTLLIDEISEVPVSFQAKLMRMIETRKYRVLGDEKEREADVRIISASNRDLRGCVIKKDFREDLFYRIDVLEIKIPPLRERSEDIKDIVMAKKNFLRGKEIGKGFWDVLHKYAWPGNIRELFTVLKRAGILCDSPIGGKDLQKIVNESNVPALYQDSDSKEDRIWQELRAGKSFWDAVKKPFLNRDLNRLEVKRIIADGLLEADGKYTKLLNIFNLKADDYHRFMRFMHEQELRP